MNPEAPVPTGAVAARRRSWRAVPALVAVLGSSLSGAVLLTAGTPTPAGALTAGRTIGGGPLDDVLYWAGQYARPGDSCGLTQQRLAAMMLTVTFSETGAGPTVAPSPMTLSRWDSQAALWAFGSKTTKYTQVFFHPGVGQWQFDSAGGWPLTAAGAIDTKVAGKFAAQTMASGYCGSASTDVPTKMRAGWRPWAYCTPTTSTLCVDLFNSVFDGTNVVVRRDDTVTSRGGMVERSCAVKNIGTVTCFFVDPAKVEGARNFTVAPVNGSPPTPITKPFYVFEAGGREYRYWLRQDTGYDATVVASKPVTANARTSLAWSTVESGAGALCDQVTRRGCAIPFGVVDSAAGAPGAVAVAGWAIDPDTTAPTRVQVTVDDTPVVEIVAGAARADVGAAYPASGPNHGFATTLTNVAPGAHTICAIALDTAAPIISHERLNCRQATVPGGSPIGTMDTLLGRSRSVRLMGWTIDPDTAAPTSVHVYVNGRFAVAAPADVNRPDVGAFFWQYGNAHGYDVAVPGLTPGLNTVCAYGIDVGVGENSLLACKTVRVYDNEPFAAGDGARRTATNQLHIDGWTLDPDSDAPTLVHVYVNDNYQGALTANGSRPDVAAAYPGYAPARGFATDFGALPAGPARVCTYVINIGVGTNHLIGCSQL